MCASRKYLYPSKGELLKIHGVRHLKAKIVKLEFKVGWEGSKQKSLCGGVWVFSGITHIGETIVARIFAQRGNKIIFGFIFRVGQGRVLKVFSITQLVN